MHMHCTVRRLIYAGHTKYSSPIQFLTISICIQYTRHVRYGSSMKLGTKTCWRFGGVWQEVVGGHDPGSNSIILVFI
jgi:hypothetical protein